MQDGSTGSAARLGRRLLGGALIVMSVLPVYRLLGSPETGVAGVVTVRVMDMQFELLWAGLLLVLPFALLGALFLPPNLIQRAGHAVEDLLARPRTARFALALALIAATAAALFAMLALAGMPNHIDSIAQLQHARFWATGRLAGPPTDDGGFWSIQNALLTPNGWVSQYPPGHVAVLAAFVRAGAAWLAGPAMIAVTILCTTLLVHELFPERRGYARLLALLVAVSPFFLFAGASFMNHVTVAAGVAAGSYALARAWRHNSAWAVPAGFAFGFAFATRPLSSLAMAGAIFVFLPFAIVRQPRARAFLRTAGLTLAGAAAPLGALFVYNTHFFGSATTFGYHAALGPRMQLGFGQDPWGNRYGVTEALGYTSSELMALGINLFESALPALVVIGLFLLLARRLQPAERLLLAWALAPVAANFFYWHHGQFMGPRMLHESAPAWAMLAGVAGVQLVRGSPAQPRGHRFNVQAGVFTAIAGSLLFGLLVLSPQRAMSYGGDWLALTRAPLPETEEPSLVFVHDAWSARVGMTLAGHGYRLDLVETLLRQNSTCAVQQLATAVAAGDEAAARRALAKLETVPRATNLPRAIEIAPGDRIRVVDGERLSADCEREARSDRQGILDLTPYLWRGDLPGGAARGALFVRDLGPARNAALIAAHPDRRPFIYAASGRRDAVLYAYDEGVRRLWGVGR